MYDVIRELLSGPGFSVVESFELKGRDARHAPIPDYLFGSPVGHHLTKRYGTDGLYLHQARALETLGRGENVVVSTGTASGKSLVFQALAMHKALQDPTSRVIVFYPLRALVEDQLRSWRQMASDLGLDEDTVGLIYGPVPRADREEVLRRARVVVMTPDVCQAWLMSRLAMPVVREFIGSLSVIVMDEAHELQGVFGSNFAFLIRRMLAARNYLIEAEGHPLQLVAATATIANPREHMQQLTGAEFSVVDSDADGARRYNRVIAHIACPEGDEISIARELQQRVMSPESKGSFITFVDSRKGVETLAMATEDDVSELFDHEAIASYRAGFKAEDRRMIEYRLRKGVLRGVVSTSALELGIDFPHLRVGFQVGVPLTRKQYRQRLGRVGRNGPGAFVVIGPPDAFRRYGTSLREYHDRSVEPSHLYLDNRFMQFAHGRCLASEREALAVGSALPTRVGWPSGFGDIYAMARPGGNRSPEYDPIAEIGGDDPHWGYPIRNIGEIRFPIKFSENSDSIGDINLSQALREAYPGATYFHQMRAYEVASWNTSTLSPYIRIRKGTRRRSTQPRITTWINSTLNGAGITGSNLRRGDSGFVAECQMLITERVDGYTLNGQFQDYRELQRNNPNMKPRSRNFRTTGIVLCIDQDWFKQGTIKRHFTDRLFEVFVHEHSLLPQDVGSTATNITILDSDQRAWRGGCVAIFDRTYGSLRLTEKLYHGFDHILERMVSAESDKDLKSVIEKVLSAVRKFQSSTAPAMLEAFSDPPRGYEQVFTPGSIVSHRKRGLMSVSVEIIQPTMMDGTLRYQVTTSVRPGEPPMRQWIPASAVEPSADADAWEYAWWNRETETYEDPPDEAD